MILALSLPAEDASPWVGLFEAALPEAKLQLHEPDAPARAEAERADYAVVAHPSATFFLEQPSPKAVFTLSAGVRHVLRMPHLPRAPIVRVEDAGMASQMVRYVSTAAMRFVQRLDTYRAQQRAGVWKQWPPRSPADVQCGVMGLGVIGGAIARALAAQGFAVRGYARSPKSIEGVRCFHGDAAPFLDGLDVLVNVLPATAHTAGILDRVALARLADGAHVVNVGRGNALVDEDLLALIDEGKIAGATLDVFREEPLPTVHRYWTDPAITITPHVAGLTIPDETVDQIARKIRALELGHAVSGVVDPEREY
ncbi:MAG: glyoxylate/hydroxypyruvate reductase A [Burkholderiales bacterium]